MELILGHQSQFLEFKSERFQKIMKGSEKFRKVPKDSKWFRKVLKHSKRFQKVPKCSERLLRFTKGYDINYLEISKHFVKSVNVSISQSRSKLQNPIYER